MATTNDSQIISLREGQKRMTVSISQQVQSAMVELAKANPEKYAGKQITLLNDAMKAIEQKKSSDYQVKQNSNFAILIRKLWNTWRHRILRRS